MNVTNSHPWARGTAKQDVRDEERAQMLSSREAIKEIGVTLKEWDVFEEVVVSRIASLCAGKKMTKLSLMNSKVSDAVILAMMKSPYLQNVRILNLSGNLVSPAQITDKSLKAIAASTSLRNLEELDLGWCGQIRETGVAAIVSSAHLPALHCIKLNNTKMTDRSLKVIAESAAFGRLQELNLRECLITDAGVVDISQSQNLANLRSLDLSLTNITDASLEAIASAAFNNFQDLDLSSCNRISDAGIALIVSSRRLALLTLNLSYTNITDVSLEAIGASVVLRNLQRLDLGGCKRISDEGVEAIARSPHLSLRTLNLSQTDVTDASLRAIASSSSFASIQELRLRRCWKIKDEGASAIAQSPHLTALRTFNLSYTVVSEELKDALRPRLNVDRQEQVDLLEL